ncbi:MAG TPA: hypothetical protein VK445_02335, partial [Dissulfurispiraceae bacterium]|nr:hypothetical protein [Dissulfurispiraceae bacterium]
RELQSGGVRIVKKHLEASRGQHYGIVVRNTTPDRIGVVIAVDGRNIISGQRSELRNTERMYILDGYGSARLDGWRTDNQTVHRFYFTEVADSYALTTFNDTSAMGVIAVAAYREKERPRSMMSAPGAASAPADAENAGKRSAALAYEKKAGTGFGDPLHAPVVTVAFEPEATPMQKTLFKYEWHEVLCRQGLLKCGPDHGNRLWDDGQYAPFPPNYPRRSFGG